MALTTKSAGTRFVILLAVAMAATTWSCAAADVSSHVRRGTDFTHYRTFSWAPSDPLPTSDQRLDRNPPFRDYLQGAVEKELQARGLERLDSGTPDLLVHSHASTTRRFDVNAIDQRDGYCVDEDCRVRAMEIEAGTIVLDVIDTRTSNVIWRGWAQQNLDAVLGEHMKRTIDEDVRRMLAMFPRGRVPAAAEPAASGGTLKVDSYVARGADLRAYRTYTWGPADRSSTGDPRLDANPFFEQSIRAAMDKQLAARQFEKRVTGPVDLLIHYHASVTQRVEAANLDREYGYCDNAACRAYVYDAGTLVIDLIDARTDKLLWRGWAEGSLDRVIDDQAWLEGRIAQAVAKIVETLPSR